MLSKQIHLFSRLPEKKEITKHRTLISIMKQFSSEQKTCSSNSEVSVSQDESLTVRVMD